MCLVFILHSVAVIYRGHLILGYGINQILSKHNAKYSPDIAQFFPIKTILLTVTLPPARFQINEADFERFKDSLKQLKSCRFTQAPHFYSPLHFNRFSEFDDIYTYADYEENGSLIVWFVYDNINQYLYVGEYIH